MVLEVDFSDRNQRNDIMKQYGGYSYPFFGENQLGERVLISVSFDNIVITTYQKNGWVRMNYYYANSDDTEEIIDGKWK